uniref:Protein kinase domain-containing protein n=1 Tax=Lactuca sativa TaxID=4236 RepID=A0A9R1VXN7_LACSA|nr:hypothetical protein LSAT_V11C400204610 [Lactuca sativa]
MELNSQKQASFFRVIRVFNFFTERMEKKKGKRIEGPNSFKLHNTYIYQILYNNWIIHRDLKPSNILVMGDGEEQGVVKIVEFGLGRIYQAPLKPLFNNGVVVTIWYRSPELLLGGKHYTNMWAVGCIFNELLTLKPLFQGEEVKATPTPFQLDQLDKIFKVLGHPIVEKWPTLAHLLHWQTDQQHIQGHK